MSATGGTDFEAQIIADLRRTHAQIKKGTIAATRIGDRSAAPWSMRLTVEEVDLLLAIVDERDALRREVCGDPTPPFPPVRAVEAVASEGCPRRDIVHDCPLGGCPTPIPTA